MLAGACGTGSMLAAHRDQPFGCSHCTRGMKPESASVRGHAHGPSVPVGQPIVLVLASGRGERFLASGGGTHKLSALLAGTPVLERTMAAVRASGLGLHVAQGAHPGMGDTIAAAVRATRSAAGQAGWLVLPGDLPLVLPGTLRTIADALATSDAVVPVVRGVRGHPVGFSARCGDALAALTGDEGARSVVARFGATLLDVDDEGCVTDVDTLDALATAEALLARRRIAP